MAKTQKVSGKLLGLKKRVWFKKNTKEYLLKDKVRVTKTNDILVSFKTWF